jgi:hypothetical protein
MIDDAPAIRRIDEKIARLAKEITEQHAMGVPIQHDNAICRKLDNNLNSVVISLEHHGEAQTGHAGPLRPRNPDTGSEQEP